MSRKFPELVWKSYFKHKKDREEEKEKHSVYPVRYKTLKTIKIPLNSNALV